MYPRIRGCSFLDGNTDPTTAIHRCAADDDDDDDDDDDESSILSCNPNHRDCSLHTLQAGFQWFERVVVW